MINDPVREEFGNCYEGERCDRRRRRGGADDLQKRVEHRGCVKGPDVYVALAQLNHLAMLQRIPTFAALQIISESRKSRHQRVILHALALLSP